MAGPQARQAPLAIGNGSATVTATFSESTPLPAGYTLFAVVMFSGTSGDIGSNSWGATLEAGSNNNGSATFLGAYQKESDGTLNSFTLNLTSAKAALKVVLLAFAGRVTATLDSARGTPFQGNQIVGLAPTEPTKGTNRIAIAALSASGSFGTVAGSWTGGFESAHEATGLFMVATAFVPQANSTPTTSSPSWTNERTLRASMWVIQGSLPAGVTDTTPPTVSITSPANNSTAHGTITLTATAADNSGAAPTVKFYLGANLLGTGVLSNGVYTLPGIDTTGVDNGAYSLRAEATDAAGNVGTAENTVIVENSTAPAITPPGLYLGGKPFLLPPGLARIYHGSRLLLGASPAVGGGNTGGGTTNPGSGTGSALTIPTQAEMPAAPFDLAAEPAYAWSTSSGPMPSPYQWMAPEDSRLRLVGHAGKGTIEGSLSGFICPNPLQDISTAGTGTNPLVYPPYGIRVRTDSTDVYFRLAQRSYSGMTNVSSRASFRLKVDGKWTSVNPKFFGTTVGYPSNPETISAGQYYLRVTFPTSTMRTIELDTHLDFGGVAVNSGAKIATAPAPQHRLAVLGDSLSGAEKHQTGNFALTGGAAGSYTALSSMVWSLAQVLGYDDLIISATGASGFGISGDTVSFKASAKIPKDITEHAPNAIFVGTSVNDMGGNRTPAQVEADADLVYGKIASDNPNALKIAFGNPTPPVMGTQANAEAAVAPYNAAKKAAAQRAGFWFVNPATGQTHDPQGVLVKTTSNWVYQRPNDISSDGQHPTQAGAHALGQTFAEAVRMAHPAGSSSGGGGTTAPPPTGAPTRIASFGMNGSHYPTRTLWVGAPHSAFDSSVVVPCTWQAIADAITRATIDYPNGNCRILVEPGQLPGYFSGSTSTPVLQNLGALGRRTRILVAPRDGVYSVTFEKSIRIHNVKGVSFVGFPISGVDHVEANGGTDQIEAGKEKATPNTSPNALSAMGINVSDVQDFAWAWSTLTHCNITGTAGGFVDGLELIELVARDNAISNTDRMGLRNVDGSYMRNVSMIGMWMAPRWRNDGTAHLDTIQSSGNSTRFENFLFQDLFLSGPSNAVIIAAGDGVEQVNATTRPVIDHSALIGGMAVSNAIYPFIEGPLPVTPTRQKPVVPLDPDNAPVCLNGQPWRPSIRDSLLSGSVKWQFETMVNTKSRTAFPAAVQPLSGSPIIEPGLFGSRESFESYGIKGIPTIQELKDMWRW